VLSPLPFTVKLVVVFTILVYTYWKEYEMLEEVGFEKARDDPFEGVTVT
jgi:type III secretory pathway component EscS